MSVMRAKIGRGGRVVIPASQRKALGLDIGDEVIALQLTSLKQAIAEAQSLVRRHNPRRKLLSESLIRDRRAEARRE
jgi:bifunctional DNA-binding transcriptional regulator/antitoxin component of YhaV-PrlF toxin-antitoxin module